MYTEYAKRRRFSSDDHLAFAQLSGDYNPLHMDRIAARRLLYGKPVVHGIHAVLWALDSYLDDSEAGGRVLSSVKVVFRSPIGLGEELSCRLQYHDGASSEMGLLSQDSTIAQMKVVWSNSDLVGSVHIPDEFPAQAQCVELSSNEVATCSGEVDLVLNGPRLSTLFPNLAKSVSRLQVAEILATTRLVGMICPGMHSIFSELELHFTPNDNGPSVLSYMVAEYDERFSRVVMRVTAPGLEGKIVAFVRPRPQVQADLESVRARVVPAEFAGQRALVVGGSRGLGEIAAKLLAAGQADLVITYHTGIEDAQRVVEEIVRGGGGRARFCALDVSEPWPDAAAILGKDWVPTHLYYFATPAIFRAKKGRFSLPLFQDFCDYYVGGFLKTVQAVRSLGPGLERVYYPSSVSIDEVPSNMGEYVAAKMAGEALCSFLEEHTRGIRILAIRLPRIATDQTASLLQVDSQDGVETMLHTLRLVNKA